MINVNMTDKAGVTLATAGKYCDQNVKVTPSADILRKDEQAKTATPTTSVQDITPDAGKALSKVTVNPITAAIVGGLDADSFASAIVAAIEGKGVTVPSGAKLDALAALIESIQAGGGGNISVSTVSFANDTNVEGAFYHNAGFVPDFVMLFPSYSLITNKTAGRTISVIWVHNSDLTESTTAPLMTSVTYCTNSTAVSNKTVTNLNQNAFIPTAEKIFFKIDNFGPKFLAGEVYTCIAAKLWGG